MNVFMSFALGLTTSRSWISYTASLTVARSSAASCGSTATLLLPNHAQRCLQPCKVRNHFASRAVFTFPTFPNNLST